MQPATVQAILLVGSLAWVGCVSCLLLLHFLPTGVHPVRDFVSSYALGRFGVLYQAQAIASGIGAACLLSVILGLRVPVPRWGLACLALYSLSRMLIAAFPADIASRRTHTGRIHVVLATTTFAGIAYAAVALTPALARRPPWNDVAGALHAATLLTAVSAAALAVAFVTRRFEPILGMIERCIYLGTLLWLGTLFVSLSAWAWNA